MTDVFNSLLKRMAEGELEKIYAQAVISVDHEEICWNGLSRRSGSIAIYSRNDVELIGTVTSLHSAVLLKESSFQGNTTLHYELQPASYHFMGESITDGILICYNGGEYIIPLHLKAPEDSNHCIFVQQNEKSTEREQEFSIFSKQQISEDSLREKEGRIKLTKLFLERMVLRKKNGEPGRQQELLKQLISVIQFLVRLKQDCIRYKLYEAVAVLEAGDVRYASKLESRIRNVVISSKKQYCTEYCILLYLQYRIAISDKQYREAGVKRQQLKDYIGVAVEKTPADQDVVLLLCSDCLNLMDTEPLDLWDTLQSVYQRGNNSPYLFFFGVCLLQKPQVNRTLDTGMDFWTGRCLFEGIKRNLITRELAEQVAQCRPEFYAPFICRMYESLYDKFSSRTLLSALCTTMIRCDMRSKRTFSYYEQAAEAGMKIARLYDYYIYTLPSGYEKPINREILLYFSLDEYINPQIYLKLCLNVLQFYREDSQIFSHYGAGIHQFLRNQIMRSNWSEDLALLAGEMLTVDMIDSDLARALIPMLYLVQVKAEVPDGCQIIFESGIYKEPQTGVFKDGKTCLCVPGGNGQFHVQDRSGKRLNGVNLKIRPLMQDEELMTRCEELCPDDAILLLMKTHAWILKKAYYKCDYRLCMQYLKDESLDMNFRKKLLRFILEYMDEYGCEYTDLQGLCRCVDMMNGKQLASFSEILIQKGYYTEAAGFLLYIPLDLVETNLLLQLAKALIQYPENESNTELMNLLIFLMNHDLLEDDLLQFLAGICRRQKEVVIKLYQICLEKGISCPELKQYLLLRLTMEAEISIELYQELFIEIVNLEQAELLIQAALNRICVYYVYGWCEMEADVMAALQSVVIHSGSIHNLTIPCQLACLKYNQEIGLSHEIEHMILKEMCIHIMNQGIALDFVHREAAQYGIAVYPVIQVNLSENGDFLKELSNELKTGKEGIWAEYYVDGEKIRYRLRMKQAYGCLYSAEIMLFAGETIHYCFHCGDSTTSWKSIADWNYSIRQMDSETEKNFIAETDLEVGKTPKPGRTEYSVSDRYCMLQQIALQLHKGESAAEQMKTYERLLRIVEAIGKK